MERETRKLNLSGHAAVKEPSAADDAPSRQTPAYVPTEKDAKEARGRMRPEVRKAYEKSLKQFGNAYKRLADM